ncbi:MAG: hypothetical protein HZB83_02365 [Deltaproteobacteria bacterium]|nr:hypothetical protein [Deltaproteobacteria bacterium]
MSLKKYLLFLTAPTIFFSGCAAGPSGPLYLRPAGETREGYEHKDNGWVFQAKAVKVSARQITKAEKEDIGLLAVYLLNKGHLLIRMDIENAGKGKVIYNPALTALIDNEVNYRKPLDYTDFFSMAANNEELEKSLRDVRAGFYDLSFTLHPGERTSRILAFKGLSATAKTAELIIKELYIGTDTVRLLFPFQFRP